MGYFYNRSIPLAEYKEHLEERVLVTEAQPQSVYSFMFSLGERSAAKSPARLEESFELDQDTGLYVAKIAFLDLDFNFAFSTVTSFTNESFLHDKHTLSNRPRITAGYLLDYGNGLDSDMLWIPEEAPLAA